MGNIGVREEHDFDRTMHLAELSLAYLRRLRTPAIPRYFELFYAYAAGLNKKLNAAVDTLLAGDSALSQTEAAKLYETFVAADKPEAKLEAVGISLGAEINAVVELLQSASDSTEAFGESLQQVSAQLGPTTSSDQLRTILHTLLTATKRMAENSHELEQRLAESKRQISELQKCLEQVRVESHTDPLTGIPNRKRFDEGIHEAIEEAKTTGAPLCLLMIDIDHFKKFNDDYGHQTGDGVLKLVARAMKANVKGRDLLARYGGEEFAIILKNTSLQGAAILAEQIRRAVMGKELVRKSTGESLGRITLSIGVATYKLGESAQSLIRRADACLYGAKRLGRNCIKAESELTPTGASGSRAA